MSITDEVVGRERNHADPAGGRQRLEHRRRLRDLRQRVCLREPLRHDLPGRLMSVPGSNTSTMDESPAIDSDWIESSQATPLSRSASSGTVMSSSTSSAERPSASVWIST